MCSAPKLDQIAFKDGVIVSVAISAMPLIADALRYLQTLINDFYASALEVLESDWLTGGSSMQEATQSEICHQAGAK